MTRAPAAGADAAPAAGKWSRRSAAKSPGRSVYRFSDAGTIRREKRRARRGHHRQFPATQHHGQPQRRCRFRRLRRWRRTRGTQRTQLPGPQTPTPAGLRQCPVDHRRSGHDQQYFPGRKTERAADLLCGRLQCQTGFLRTDRGEKDQPEGGHQERYQSRRKRHRHSRRQRPGAQERVRRDQRAPGSHRPRRAASRRPQRQQRRRRRRLGLRWSAGPRALLRGGRRQGHTSQAQHRLRLARRRREGPVGLAVLYRIPLPRSLEDRGRPEHGHDRPDQGTGLHRSRHHPRSGEPGRDPGGRPEYLERRSGEDHRDREQHRIRN